MNRLLYTSLALTLVLAPTCKKTQTQTSVSTAKVRPVRVDIKVSRDGSGDFSIAASPDPVEIHRSKHEVLQFCVSFPPPVENTIVTAFNFVKTGDPNRKNPFGNKDADNIFDIADYHFNCFVKSMEAAPPPVPGASEEFKYSISIKVAGTLVKTLDPHVIISE